MNKKRTDDLHIRTTPETITRLEALSDHLSMSKTALVQMAINDLFRRYERQPDRTTEERAK